MDAQFWIDKWNEGQIGFHKNEYNPTLLKHFPLLQLEKDQRILVPLCGKSMDLLWLHQAGLDVHGIELSELAAKAFFAENNLSFTQEEKKSFVDYKMPHLTISCGDFFELDKVGKYEAIYDRAALVALPLEMRKKYARVISNALIKGGKYLLVVFEYNQAEMAGPPFSVTGEEIEELYGKDFNIRQVESERPVLEGPRLLELSGFTQNIYLLEKTL